MRTTRVCCRLLSTLAPVACLLLFAGVPSVWADVVSGHVTLDGRPAANSVLVVRTEEKKGGAIEVRTTDKGFYRVFLQPGRYQVTLKDRPAEVLVLESLPAPVTRDLAFGRR
ncbi:MAG: hypothetical protein KJ061_09665 [Vicinamibacteraceae bacterium]|nr:hypothetical protein [Vicinamibacteraceae bacterium]